jgi:hypothetical protein
VKRIIRVVLGAVLAAAAVSGGTSLCAAADTASGAKVIAYYFHGNFRCYTCTNMEQYSREAIEANFKEELASGRLQFRAVNVEKRENEHFIREYQLYTKALVLSLVKDGKEARSKNLARIWELSRDKREFIEYVTAEVAAFLKEAR